MSDTPETIYLIPDASEGVLGHVWCDDPAPGIGMEPDDAIEYRRADTVDTELTAAKARIAELEAALRKAAGRLERYAVQVDGEWGLYRGAAELYADGDMPEELIAINSLLNREAP